MRFHCNAALFTAQIGLCILALPASAAPIFVNADTTISSSATGDVGTTGAPDDDGTTAGAAIIWTNTGVDVTILSGYTFTGGVGGLGGVDAANDGGSKGGAGGDGLLMTESAGTVTATGIFIFGGVGGDGRQGGTGGVSDTAGGAGRLGGFGVFIQTDAVEVDLTNTTVTGATGGNGAAAGDAAGDGANAASGGVGGPGGSGFYVQFSGNVVSVTGSTVSGGDGGVGGASLANATNAKGGNGGHGINDVGMGTQITVGAGSLVQGGSGGGAGTGGVGGTKGSSGAGIWLGGSGANLTNFGVVSGGIGAAAAIAIIGDTAEIDNYGTIGSTGGLSGGGVQLYNGTLTMLHNRVGGLIASSGTEGGVVLSLGTTITTFLNEGSIGGNDGINAVRVFGEIGSFTNSGVIESGNPSALAIFNASMADVVDNTGGVITNSGSNSTVYIGTDLGAAGIVFKGGQFTNTGGFAAIYADTSQLGSIGIEDATINGGVLFASGNETLNVSGSTLNGDITFAAGNNNLNFLGGTTTLVSNTQFVNATFVSVFAGADVVSNGAQTDANSSIGQLTMNAGSSLTLNEDFWADDEVLNNSEITIAAGKVLTSNVVNGDGVYAFGVTDAATVGKVVAQGTGSSIDFTGATLQIVLDNPLDNFVAGTNFLLVEDLNGNDILGVTNGTALLDNSALLTFILYRGDAGQIGLTSDLLFAQIGQLLLADIAGEGDDPNSIALGAALDTIGLDGDADLDDLMLALAMLPTNEDINDMLDALLPETDGVAYDLATDAGDQMLDVASRRLDGLRGSAGASLEYRVASLSLLGLRGTSAAASRNQFWGQAFGRWVDQSKHSFNEGYDAGSYGFAVGADTALSNATQLGAALSYASTNADGNGINRTDTDVESYQLTLYGDHLFGNAVYAKGLLAFGWHNNDIARHDVGGIAGNTATGGYGASAVNLRAELGRAYAGGGTLSLIPRATLNAAWYSPDGYSEQGVGGLGLTVVPDDLASMRLGIGVLARWDVKLAGGELFQPELRFDYRRDLTRERFETTSEFLGAPGIVFRTQGVEPAADILNLGVGALLATAAGVDIRASYDLEVKEDYIAHGGYFRASVPF